jgi:hypothetical protein
LIENKAKWFDLSNQEDLVIYIKNWTGKEKARRVRRGGLVVLF